MSRFVLVHSPFVGPVSWRALADLMPEASVALYGGVRGPRWYEDVGETVAAGLDHAGAIVVLHSGAGGFAPAIAAAAGSRLKGLVLLDAVLPYPGVSCLSTAPRPLADELRRLTTEDRLAPWNRWFAEDPTVDMIPDPELRAAFVADLPRTPFAFLQAVCPADVAWERTPTAYVQLSRGYERTARQAADRGWPVLRAELHHLAMASHPDAVAGLLREAAARLPGGGLP